MQMQEIIKFDKIVFGKNGIFAIPIVSQSYDGAAVMSGVANGLQKLLTNYHPHAYIPLFHLFHTLFHYHISHAYIPSTLYIHYISHRLNFYTNKLVENQSRITGTLEF